MAYFKLPVALFAYNAIFSSMLDPPKCLYLIFSVEFMNPRFVQQWLLVIVIYTCITLDNNYNVQ